MENNGTVEGSEIQESSEQTVGNGSSDTSGVGGDNSANNDATGSGASDQTPESGETQDEFVKDDDGNEYIPRKAFEARIAKLSAQKNDARSFLLESIKSDPSVKKELMQALGIEENPNSSGQNTRENDEPTRFEKWIAPMPPEHQAHYRGLVEALVPDFEAYVKESIESALKPVLSHIGEEKIKTFSSTNKDFPRYQEKIHTLLSSGRAKTVEDAYILASHEDKLKQVSTSATRREENRQQTIQKPISKGSTSPGGPSQKKPQSLKEALMFSARQTGYLKE